MGAIADNLTELIGHTPLLRLGRFGSEYGALGNLIVKLEYFNPLGSVKDRIALAMVNEAENKGLLKPGATIIEPTSGNTGIGLAFVAAIKKYKVILVMPETMSVERRVLLKALGAQLVLTPGALGMQGAINKADELCSLIEGSWIPQQFDNEANPKAHRESTAQEILADTGGLVDVFVAGVGTGGTLTGVGEVLKKAKNTVHIVAVEPYESSVLSGLEPAPHEIQGIGAGFIPQVLNSSIVDEIFRVRIKEATEIVQAVARLEGLLVGISSGAALFAALNLAKREEYAGKNIVALLPDSGERYLSTPLFSV